MEIKKVIIDNFKSIDHIELDFDKVGDSYTKIFVGVNESGKSNILEALSYFKVPGNNVSSDSFCNQKFDDRDACSILFKLEFNPNTFSLNEKNGKEPTINIALSNITKKVYLAKKANRFECSYDYDIELLENNLFIKNTQMPNQFGGGRVTTDRIVDESGKDANSKPLTKEYILQKYKKTIDDYVQKNETVVSVWQPSSDYLLSNVNLNTFSQDIDSNKPLRNIFFLSGFTEQKTIADAISKVGNHKNRSILSSKLNKAINSYINKVWSNKINIVIEITETGFLTFLIRDQGEENEHNRFEITERSQGAQQFLSLILSLSLEAESHERKNELILIDEPETHLHPSGIRDLGRELLKIGHDNYVFLATHSPFIIDKKHKERHYIVKKNKNAITEVIRIKESDNLIDDEVLNEAFGINVYQDLLNPHSILVEGATDKVILQKVFCLLERKDIGITNGHGTNIDTLASKMNFDNISVLVVTDDDKDGKKYKDNILKIGGVFNENNVFTIRDLEGRIIDQGTIEDALGIDYIQSQFGDYYNNKFGQEISEFNLSNDQPVISQIIVFLKRKKKYNSLIIDEFKKRLSDNFNPTKQALNKKYIHLKGLAEKIIEKLN
jgi:predicted ATP-dependent endonuclease of OLD family